MLELREEPVLLLLQVVALVYLGLQTQDVLEVPLLVDILSFIGLLVLRLIRQILRGALQSNALSLVLTRGLALRLALSRGV